MVKAKPKKSVKKKAKKGVKKRPVKKVQKKQPKTAVEPAKKRKCVACEAAKPYTCPFCTREGLLLIVAAIILIAVDKPYTHYVAWGCLLLAFFVPLLKHHWGSKK